MRLLISMLNRLLIRITDFLGASIGLIVLSPILLIFSILILLDSKGGIFYKQIRVGRNNKDFKLFKFRSMATGSDKGSLITIGEKDSRITGIGSFLRRYKLDEIPQLINVLKGDMSAVGPRPEVRRYVDLYTKEQMRVLEVKPGMTDHASIEFRNENEILGKSENPDKTYIEEIMPRKIELNMRFINNPSFLNYLGIVFKTLFKIFR